MSDIPAPIPVADPPAPDIKLDCLGVGDEVVLVNVAKPSVTLSGTVARVISSPRGVDLEDIPFTVPIRGNALETTGWKIESHTPSVPLPSELGIYRGAQGQLIELKEGASWFVNGSKATTTTMIRDALPLVKLESVPQTASNVLDAVVSKLDYEAVGEVGMDSIHSAVVGVRAEFGVEIGQPSMQPEPPHLPDPEVPGPAEQTPSESPDDVYKPTE